MLNILSFAEVRKQFRITIYTEKSATMKIHIGNGKIMQFQELEEGLYMFRPESQTSAFSYLTLVSANEGDFLKRKVAGAKQAQELYRKIGYPGYKKFFKLLEKNYFRNCPVTTDDVKRVLYIYAVDLAVPKGKMTRPSAVPIVNRPPVIIPKTITDLHPTINVSVDYLFIQSIPFLHTFSWI